MNFEILDKTYKWPYRLVNRSPDAILRCIFVNQIIMGSFNDLVLNRRLVITWINADTVLWCMYALLELNVLMASQTCVKYAIMCKSADTNL